MVEQAEATRWRVLLVDADGDVREQLRSAWVRGPLDLHHADDIATAARLHQAVPFDALLLDTDQMTGPGLSWCRSLRAAGDDTPLVMLSGHATEIDRIVGLEAGADDFVSKPIHPRELQARLQAIVRRGSAGESPGSPARSTEVIHFGPFEFNLHRRELRKGPDPVPLTTGEYAMLKALARHPGQALTREQLSRMARGRAFGPFDRSLDVQVSRLRRVLEDDPAHPRFIQTVWGVGYVFIPDGAPGPASTGTPPEPR